jgi:hypothetical protein
MKFVNNAIRTSTLRFAVVAAFMICLVPPVFAARIDDGRPVRQASTVTPAATQTKTEEKSPAADQNGKVVIVQPSGPALPEKSQSAQVASEPAEAPQIDKTGAAPSSMALGQETILRRAEDKASAKKTPAAPAIRKTTDKYVTLDFDNVNIEVFVKFISELTGKNFIIDEKVKGKVTILSPRKIPLRDVYKVFLSVLEINGFATVPVGDMIKIVPSAADYRTGAGQPRRSQACAGSDYFQIQFGAGLSAGGYSDCYRLSIQHPAVARDCQSAGCGSRGRTNYLSAPAKCLRVGSGQVYDSRISAAPPQPHAGSDSGRSQNKFHDYLCQCRRYGKRAQAGGDDG